MNSAPTITAAIRAAAKPAIHTGPRRSGASTSAGCTRAVKPAAGGAFAAGGPAQPHDRPPPLPPYHAALVGDDRQEPRPQRPLVAAKLAKLPPRLDRSLLHRILCGVSVGEHDRRQAKCRVEQR